VIVVDAAVAADVAVVRQWMQEEPTAPAWSAADLAAAMGGVSGARERRAWMAEMDGVGAVGFVTASALCMPEGAAEGELEYVLVRPAARRRGVGGALVGAAAAWMRELRADEVRLEVRASNAAAQRLYASCGFVEAGRRRGYYAHPEEDAVLMRLVLNG